MIVFIFLFANFRGIRIVLIILTPGKHTKMVLMGLCGIKSLKVKI